MFAFCTHTLITQCAFWSEIQSANLRKRLITCGGPYASPGFIYTHPVNSTASELGWSPDHYLTIHSAVSQSYLKKWPLLNLWQCSAPLVKSQTLGRESSSAAVFMAAVPLQICSTNILSKLKWKAPTRRSTEQKVFMFRNKIFEKGLLIWNNYCLCECKLYLGKTANFTMWCPQVVEGGKWIS